MERRSTVYVRVERLVNEYYSAPNSHLILISSHHSSAPELFNFSINSSTNFSQIFIILHHQYKLNSQLSRTLASQIFRKAANMGRGTISIRLSVLVKITQDTALEIVDNKDLVQNLLRDCVIGDELGLEKESCSICLENLLEDSKKVPMRMVCSHLFHDQCIVQWVCCKNSCPVCRRVFYE